MGCILGIYLPDPPLYKNGPLSEKRWMVIQTIHPSFRVFKRNRWVYTNTIFTKRDANLSNVHTVMYTVQAS